MTPAEQKFIESRAEYLNNLKFLTPKEVIAILRISKRSFYQKVLPLLPSLRLSSRKILITENALAQFIEARTEIINNEQQQEGEEIYDDEDY
jgi:hypothetical protein